MVFVKTLQVFIGFHENAIGFHRVFMKFLKVFTGSYQNLIDQRY